VVILGADFRLLADRRRSAGPLPLPFRHRRARSTEPPPVFSFPRETSHYRPAGPMFFPNFGIRMARVFFFFLFKSAPTSCIRCKGRHTIFISPPSFFFFRRPQDHGALFPPARESIFFVFQAHFFSGFPVFARQQAHDSIFFFFSLCSSFLIDRRPFSLRVRSKPGVFFFALILHQRTAPVSPTGNGIGWPVPLFFFPL